MKKCLIRFMLRKPYWLFLLLPILLFGYPVGYFVLDSNELFQQEITPAVGDKQGTNIYVINLDRSIKRYEYIKDNINSLGLNVERISAIDGHNLSKEAISTKVDLESYKLFMGHYPKAGTIGCSLSHIKAWQTFLNSHFEFAVIFEDDVSFDPNKLKPVIEYLVKNNELWDIASFEISHKGLPLTIKNIVNNQKLAVYLTEVTHAGAYVINRKTAQKLLEKALPIKMPIDYYFTRPWEFNIKFVGIENPRLVDQTFGQSEIAKTQTLLHEKITISEKCKRTMFKLQSYVIRVLYNLKVYFTMRKTP